MLEIPEEANAALGQKMIGWSKFSQKYCTLMGDIGK